MPLDHAFHSKFSHPSMTESRQREPWSRTLKSGGPFWLGRTQLMDFMGNSSAYRNMEKIPSVQNFYTFFLKTSEPTLIRLYCLAGKMAKNAYKKYILSKKPENTPGSLKIPLAERIHARKGESVVRSVKTPCCGKEETHGQNEPQLPRLWDSTWERAPSCTFQRHQKKILKKPSPAPFIPNTNKKSLAGHQSSIFYWFMKWKYHNFNQRYMIWNLAIYFWNLLLAKMKLFRLNQFCLSSSNLSTSSLLCTNCLLRRKSWKVIILMFNFLESHLYLLFILKKRNSLSRACSAWSDLS